MREISLTVPMLLLTACAAARAPLTPERSMVLPEPQSSAIAVVRVPSPWWAPNFLITGRFVDSVPEYAAAPGLRHKAYTFSEQRQFGGVYLWESRAAAERWFDDAWHERVRRQRGVDGDVRILDARFTLSGDAQPSGRELPHHALKSDALVTWLSSTAAAPDFERLAASVPLADGLVRVSLVTDGDGRAGVVSLWTDRAAAQRYWTPERRSAVERVLGPTELLWFDAPVLLDAAADRAEASR
jgi:heme-degrading monooxygenase HmoA